MRNTAQLGTIFVILALGLAWGESRARIDVYGGGSQGVLELVETSENLIGHRCSWLKEEGRVNRSWSLNTGKLSTEWEELTFTLQADADMSASVVIRGKWQKAGEDGKLPQTNTWYDGIAAEGTEVLNPGFEEVLPDGRAQRWKFRAYEGEGPKVIEDASKAKEGTRFLQATSHRNAVQTISLKAGQPARFSIWIRAAE